MKIQVGTWRRPSSRIAARFWTSEDGSIAPLFGLLIIVILSVGGLALDFDRGTQMKSRLNDAADAANLAAARAAIDMANLDGQRSKSEIAAEAATIGKNIFVANLQTLGGATVTSNNVVVTYDKGNWTSKIDFSAKMQASLAAAAGIDSLDLSGTAEATVAPGKAALDIAMCVDSTGSMQPTLDAVKANAMNFYNSLNTELQNRNMSAFPVVRVRMIYFKDYGDEMPGYWDPDPMRASQFFSLPSEASNFDSFVSPQVAWGGLDATESGLECLNEAIDSPWLKPGDVPTGHTDPVTDVYPLIVVWTDTSARAPGYANALANPDYPPSTKMPRTYADFLAKWNSQASIDQTNKQILFFGDPSVDWDVPSLPQNGGWREVKNWPEFVVGGTLLEGNTSMIEFLAEGIATKTKALRVSQ